MYGNPNVSYVVPDTGNTYPYYPYVPGNFSITGEHNPNQIDRMYYNDSMYIYFIILILIVKKIIIMNSNACACICSMVMHLYYNVR